MATRTRLRRSARDWQQLIAEYESSGQVQSVFCAERGLALSTFSYWRRKLGTRDFEAEPAFVELSCERPESPVPAWDVELDLGRGMTLRIRQGC